MTVTRENAASPRPYSLGVWNRPARMRLIWRLPELLRRKLIPTPARTGAEPQDRIGEAVAACKERITN